MALGDILNFVLPKRRSKPAGAGSTPTYNPDNSSTPLSRPAARDHLQDIFSTRQANDANTLMETLFRMDPDVSAAVNAYLTVADTTPRWVVYDKEGNIDREGHKALDQLLEYLFGRVDYTQPAPFAMKPGMRSTFEQMRSMILLRGSLATEMVLDKQMLPSELRLLDPLTIEFTEKNPGVYFPEQVISGNRISLDVPNFFMAYFRKDPTRVYSSSFFVAAINTIAARQQVINDLYRIMNKTGYPRIKATVLEEVLRKNAPAAAKEDEVEMQKFINARLNDISQRISNLRADESLVTPDSVETGILNDRNPGAGIDVSKVIDALNDSNQAALKVMSTVIGRGDKGVNTASVEARIFALSAEQVNMPIEETMSKALTLALRLHGLESRVKFWFEPVEMRPQLELENQKTLRQTRLLEQLSLGLISDDEYHLEVNGKIRPDQIQEMSGTNFLTRKDSVDPEQRDRQSDAQERQERPDDRQSSRDGRVQRNRPSN